MSQGKPLVEVLAPYITEQDEKNIEAFLNVEEKE